MSFNKAMLNYIFKVRENDSQSVESNTLLKEISSEIKQAQYNNASVKNMAAYEFPLEFKIDSIEKIEQNTNSRVNLTKEIIREKLAELTVKLEKCKLSVKQALIAERTLIGESYTAVVPLEKEYVSDKTTATVKDNIVFGSGFLSEPSGKNLLKLDTIYMSGQEDTEFKIVSKENTYPLRLRLKRNYYNKYQQVKINLPKITQSGILYIEFAQIETISILNKEGYEIVSKFVTDRIEFPVNNGSISFSLRLHDNREKELQIKALYFTEQIYNTQTIFETLPFAVGQDLTFLTIQTCDNYTDKNVKIKYEIAINDQGYEEFRPNGKLRDNLTQSIIKTSKFNFENILKLENPVLDNGTFKFYTEDLVSSEVKFRSFAGKFGVDFLSLENFIGSDGKYFLSTEDSEMILTETNTPLKKESLISLDKGERLLKLFIVVKENFDVVLNDIIEMEVDGFLINKETYKDGKYTFKRGIREVSISDVYWKEIIDLEKYYIEKITEGTMEVVERETGTKTILDFYYDPKAPLYTSLYLQIFNKKVDIFLYEETLKRKYDDQHVEYYYKENPYPVYVITEATSLRVDGLQIRVTMKSLNEITCPFISNMTIRGI